MLALVTAGSNRAVPAVQFCGKAVPVLSQLSDSFQSLLEKTRFLKLSHLFRDLME